MTMSPQVVNTVDHLKTWSSSKNTLPAPSTETISGTDYFVYSIPLQFQSGRLLGVEIGFTAVTTARPVVPVSFNYVDNDNVLHTCAYGTITCNNAPAGSPVNINSSLWIGPNATASQIETPLAYFHGSLKATLGVTVGDVTAARAALFNNMIAEIYFPVITFGALTNEIYHVKAYSLPYTP